MGTRHCGFLGPAVAALALIVLGAGSSHAQRLPELEQTGVVVPWADFKKILDEIRREEPAVTPEPPPVDFAFSACDVRAVVTEDEQQVRVSLKLSVQVLNAERWIEVPVIADGMALSRFEIDGRAANVYRKNGFHNIALRGAGRRELELDYLAPVSDSRGSRSSLLRFPQAPVIALDLTVPRRQLSFSIGGAVIRSSERTNGSTRVLAAFQQARDTSITWFKEAELGEKETKLLGELHTLLSVGEGMLRGTTNAVYTIHGKGLDTFRLEVPADVTVLDVRAQGIDDWSVGPADAAEDTKILTVRLGYLAQGNYSFALSLERALGDTTAETRVPDLRILDAIRDKGFIAVSAATNVEINPVGKLGNATPVDPAELPANLAAMTVQPVLYGFKYLRHPVEIGLSIVKHDDLAVKRTIVESARLYTYLSPEGKRITSACYRIKNNRKQYLEVTLPEGGEGWATYVDDLPVKAARAEDGKILIPLRKAATGAGGELEAFDVELVYFQRSAYRSLGRHRFDGPQLDVDAMEVQWHFFLPRDKRYSGFDGNLHADAELNDVVYVDATAYNRRAGDDASALQSFGYVDRQGGAFDLEQKLDGPAEPDDEARARGKSKRAELERELDQLKNRPSKPSNEGLRAPQTQAMSNVGGDLSDAYRAAGRVRGVLPVRFAIPVDGLRLSFTGRILTAAETPAISVSYWPAVWALSGTAGLLLTFALTLVALLAGSFSRSWVHRIAVVVPALAALLGLFVLVPGLRRPFGAGVVLALVLVFAGRALMRWRTASSTALLLLVLGVLAGATDVHATEGAVAGRAPMPDLHGTEITLAWPDFKTLVERTYVPPPTPPAPPTDAFLRAAEYSGRLEPGILTVEGTLELEVLKEGWVRVPLGTEGTVVRFEGEGALLNRQGSQLEVLASGPKSYTLSLTLAFEAGDHPGENRLAIRLPDAARTLLDLQTDEVFRDLAVESGLAYDTRTDRIYVSLTGGTFAMKYTLPFRRLEEAAGEEVQLEPRVQLAAYQMLTLGDGVISGALIHDYNVRVAEVSHFDLDLPEEVVIFDCHVDGLESWKILQRDGERYLRVKLLAPTDGRVRVVVSFEGTYDAEIGRVPVPRFPPVDVERESGFVAVAADGAEVDLQLTGRLLPADVSEVPADVRAYGGNLIAVFKYSGEPDPATASVTEHDDAPVLTAIIESLNATAALLENGTEATWIDLTLKNNRKQFLKLTVPGEEVEVWSLLLNGEPAKPKRTGDDVLVPLPRGDSETTSRISLVLLRRGERVLSFRRLEPYLPSFDIPVSEALWTVYLPSGKRYVTGSGEFRPVVVTDPLVPVGAATFRRSVSQGSYSEVASAEVAEAQVQQEDAIGKQLAQKGAARKGSLPVRIAIPGGINRLPRITVSRMLIVGAEPNTIGIHVFPVWASAVLRAIQPLLILGASLGAGLLLAGLARRRWWSWTVLAGALSLIPFSGIGSLRALFLLALFTLIARVSVSLVRRFRAERSA